MADLTPFIAGIEAARKQSYISDQDPRTSFYDFIIKLGYKVNGQIELGRIIRLDSPFDKPNKKTGWYSYNEIETDSGVIGVAAYGDWKTGNKDTWSSKSVHTMSIQESLKYHAEMEAARTRREIEQKAIHDEAAQKAYSIWQGANTDYIPEVGNDNSDGVKVIASHPYMVKKGIKPTGQEKFSRGNIVIPVMSDNILTSLQFIMPDGSKRFLTGGRKKGCYFIIKGRTDLVLICEGYATGNTLNAASGATVYVAFDAGNLYEVTQQAVKDNQAAKVIVCGDDDSFTESGNTGRTKAQQVCDGIGVECLFPSFLTTETSPTDFNDMASINGLKSVSDLFVQKSYKPYSGEIAESAERIEERLKKESPSGILGEIVNYYNSTSGNKQYGFAIQTALAIGSIVCSRNYESNLENRSSLYFLNLGKSGTGKEHIKKTIEKILDAADCGYLVGGDGYTAGSSVISALMSRPRHIAVIDEFSKNLEAAQNKYGASHLMEANQKLMEAWGRCIGVMRPKSYSTIGLAKDKAKELENIRIEDPAITLCAMSTPDDFFKVIGVREIKDGFLNRFIINISDAEREIRRHKEPLPVPESIINWIKSINERRGGSVDVASEKPNVINLTFSIDALAAQEEFQKYCIDIANAMEGMGISEISARSNESAMRLSLICALSENPMATVIEKHHIDWSIYWIKTNLNAIVKKLKMTVSNSAYEGDKKEVLQAIRESKDGVTWVSMQKRTPYSKHKAKDLKEILTSLCDADLIIEEAYQSGRGRPTKIYRAIQDD